MAKHAVVRLDRLSGTIDGSKLASVKIFDGTDPIEVDNGNFVHITSDMVDREVFKATKMEAGDDKTTIGLVASVEIDPTLNTKYPDLEDFTNRAGTVARVYRMETNDIFSVTAEAFASTPSDGDYISVDAGETQMTVGSTATGAFAECIAVETVGRRTYYVFKVL